MDTDQGPLSPEHGKVLQSYHVFLEQARYKRVVERLRVAETCLRTLQPRTKPIEPRVFAAYQRELTEHAAQCLFAFRCYLIQLGWLAQNEAEPLEGRIASLPEPTASWLRRYVREMKRHNLARGTIERRVWVIVRWLRRCSPPQQADLRLIDRDAVEMMIERAQDRGNAPGTINTQLSDLHHFFLYLRREGVLPDSPILRRHWLREPDALPRAMAPDEVVRFLSVVEGVQDRAIFLVLLRSGIRGSELVGLQVEDVDLARQSLHIRQGTAKMSKSRVVYLSDDATAALKAWIKERGEVPTARLFFWWPRLSLTRDTINWRFKRYLRVAGITKRCTAHCLRHTFATELLNAGVSLVTVQELLGHERIGTTQIYARLSGVVKQGEYIAAMAKIEQRHRMLAEVGG